MERAVYLNLTPPAEARRIWLEKISRECSGPASEFIPLTESAGRVTSAPILAARSSPAFHGAAMDGFAVRAQDTFAASERRPLSLELGKSAWAVNTGQPLPEGADAVIMIEEANLDDGGAFISIEKPAFPWQHVRKAGEDIVETEVILPPGTLIGAQEIGALAAGGVLKPEVFKRPLAAILPTGSDLAPLFEADDADLRKGKVLPEFNSLILSAMLSAAGAEPLIMPIVPDDPAAIKKALAEAAEAGADLILINAGTSAGSHDFSVKALSECGEELIHGVAMMPGKPAALGIVRLGGRAIPAACVPGYPVSAWTVMREFTLPLLAMWQNREPDSEEIIEVLPINPLPSKAGMEELLRVKTGIVDGKAWAAPLPRGAGAVTSLSRADAILAIPPDSEGLDAGKPAKARLLRPASQIRGALLAIGSHDNALDIIDSFLRRTHPRFRLTSAHAGSLGGLLALSRGQAHLAGSHLLDPETGVYNKAAIRQNLKGIPAALVRLAGREQGLMTAKNNPAAPKSIEDLARGDIRFINRQRGSGTRVLLDWELAKRGLSGADIKGYEDEEYTHMNVAQAVLSGRADAGLGIRAAANALNLDFTPIGQEEYDLVIPLRYMDDERVQALLEVIRSQEFKDKVKAMGGYDTSRTGGIVWEYDGA